MVKTLSNAEMGLDKFDVVDTISLHEDESVGSHGEEALGDLSSNTPSAVNSENRGDGSFMVYAVLFIATLVFGAATYLMVAANQTKFQAEFQSYAREFSDTANKNTQNIFGQLGSLSSAITANAIENDGGFPAVTIPHFDRRTEQIAEYTGVDVVMFLPFVEEENKAQWEAHAIRSQDWLVDDYVFRGWDPSVVERIPEAIYACSFCDNVTSPDFFDDREGSEEEITSQLLSNLGYSDSLRVPVSQFGPGPTNSSLSMFDLFTHPTFKREMLASLEHDSAQILSGATSELSFVLDYVQTPANYNADHEWRAIMLEPVKEDFSADARTVGFLVAVVTWQAIFDIALPETVNGINVVVESDCGNVFTYTANGGGDSTAVAGDIHDERYRGLVVRYPFISTEEQVEGVTQLCQFDLAIYPTDIFRQSFDSTDPSIYSGLIVVVFIFIAGIFFLYDKYTQKRQDEVALQAKRAEAIVTSVFPKAVGLRLIEQAERDESGKVSDKKMLNNFLVKNGDMGHSSSQRSKPIADLFPSTTVMFADIVGFTAWSSMREPSQVFVLLETIYKEFDTLAKRRKVFKVETVGDCYVAVCGLPDPRKDHPIVMALFAGECITRMAAEVQALEVELGPDTADLGIRIGLHSGPVTAGVLRGDRARFQLFGDTVNTCARIETTGTRNRIHISKSTADLLSEMGKGHWFIPRGDKVSAKGKGELETFWLKLIRSGDNGSVVSASSNVPTESSMAQAAKAEQSPAMLKRRMSMQGSIQRKLQNLNPKKFERLVNWNVDVLLTILTQVEERRQQARTKADAKDKIRKLEMELGSSTGANNNLDEVVEAIELPRFNSNYSTPLRVQVELDNQVQIQLKEYVSLIASMYNDNPFHNFEHASHVTMSVMKLLSRIVGPDIDGDDAQELHDHTYGITSDPLTQFAVVFSALLHDVDHLGVPNTQLVKEARELAQMYNNKSVAEQNSIDLAWGLLMEDRFQILRRSIYATEAEFRRFRQLLVNTILATDIMDKELKQLRNAKWDKAFAESSMCVSPEKDSVREITNRKATVVIEHLIQASDVAHTMQHWQVYRKWNARLFKELYQSYLEGHSDKDPSEGWYEGEMGFFDYYILPLAKKLQDCGVFGVASHEYLNYAEQNRKEWEAKGKLVVAEFIKEAQDEKLARQNSSATQKPLLPSNTYWDWS